jgi:hypothetical protein
MKTTITRAVRGRERASRLGGRKSGGGLAGEGGDKVVGVNRARCPEQRRRETTSLRKTSILPACVLIRVRRTKVRVVGHVLAAPAVDPPRAAAPPAAAAPPSAAALGVVRRRHGCRWVPLSRRLTSDFFWPAFFLIVSKNFPFPPPKIPTPP